MSDSQEENKAKPNLGGRPTKYSKEMQKLADQYVDECGLYVDVDGKKLPNSIPSIVGLALKLKVHRETIANWAKAERQFFDTLENIKQKQELFLIHHGLTKGYDSGFAKFLAINVTRFKDKIEHTIDKATIAVNIDKEDEKL